MYMASHEKLSQAHWSPEADFSSIPFFIRRMDTSGHVKPAEVPEAHLPLIGFRNKMQG